MRRLAVFATIFLSRYSFGNTQGGVTSIRKKTSIERVINEYEKIAFSEDQEVKTADRLRALDQYAKYIQSSEARCSGEIKIYYDYGE